jgi:hypothetical protein
MSLSMLTLTGVVTHTFEAPKGVNKEGKDYGGGDKVQLLCNIPLPNGEYRVDVVTLGTDQVAYFKDRIGKNVSLPVGAFPAGKAVQFFILKSVRLEAAA